MELKAKNLRLGNLVYAIELDENGVKTVKRTLCKINSLYDEDFPSEYPFTVTPVNKEDEINELLDGVEAVPITSGLLEEFEFVKNKEDGYVLEVGFYTFEFDKYMDLVKIHSGSGSIDEGFDNIKYAHQLQNLIHTLESEELTLK